MAYRGTRARTSRLGALVAMTIVLVFALASPASAAEAVVGTATSTGGDGFTTVDLAFTLVLAPPGATTSGTAVLVRSDGSSLSGTETSTVDFSSFLVAVVIQMHVASGTGALSGDSANLVLTGRSAGPGSIGDAFALSGTLTTPLPVPTDMDQCKGGSWRNYFDNHGLPFKDQGQCVSFVNHS